MSSLTLSPVLGTRLSTMLGREPSFYSRLISCPGKMRCQFSLGKTTLSAPKSRTNTVLLYLSEFSDLCDVFECGDGLQTFAVVKVTNDRVVDGGTSWALIGRTPHTQVGRV